jgi:hypothetical protein
VFTEELDVAEEDGSTAAVDELARPGGPSAEAAIF